MSIKEISQNLSDKIGFVWFTANWTTLLSGINWLHIIGACSSLAMLVFYILKGYREYLNIKSSRRSDKFFNKIEQQVMEKRNKEKQ